MNAREDYPLLAWMEGSAPWPEGEKPNRHLVAELVATGRLTPVDTRQPLPRWSFATSAVRRYIDGTAAPVPALTLVAQEAS